MALGCSIIYHAGPTNSGKTYNALQAMTAAKSGVYCGPLRLLAMEVYDTCNAEGLCCNLITGELEGVDGVGWQAAVWNCLVVWDWELSLVPLPASSQRSRQAVWSRASLAPCCRWPPYTLPP